MGWGKNLGSVRKEEREARCWLCNQQHPFHEKVEVLVPQSRLIFATPWTVAHQTLLSMGFSRQEYWNELPFPSPGDLPDPGIEPWSPALQVNSLPSEPPGAKK